MTDDDFLGLGAEPFDVPGSIEPNVVDDRRERKGLEKSKPTVDWGLDDKPATPAPKAKADTVDWGLNDKPVGLIKDPPLPRARPTQLRPTEPMPDVQPLDDAPFRAGGKVVDSVAGPEWGMLSGEEAFKNKQADIAAAERSAAEATSAFDQAQRDYADLAMKGVTGQTELRKRRGLENLRKAKDEADAAVLTARNAPLRTQGSVRDTVERVPDVATSMVMDTVRAATRLPMSQLTSTDRVVSKLFGSKPHDFSLIDKTLDNEVQTIKNYVGQNLFKKDEAQNEQLGSKIVSGITSTAVFAAGGAAGRAAGLAPFLTTAVLGALPQGEQQLQQAKSAADINPLYAQAWMKNHGLKVTAEQANDLVKWSMFATGLGIGTSEAVPIGHMFQRLEKATGGGLTRYIGLVAAQAGEEAIQEGVQQLLQNTATRLFLDPNQEITKDVAENMLVGAISGGVVTGTIAAPSSLSDSISAVRTRLNVPVPDTSPVPNESIMEQAGAPAAAQTAEAPATPPVPEAAGPAPSAQRQAPATPSSVQKELGVGYVEASRVAAERNLHEPAPAEPASPDDQTAILRAYGYTDEQISDMSETQRAAEIAEALDAGVEPAAAEAVDKGMPLAGAVAAQEATAAPAEPVDWGMDDHVVGTRQMPVQPETAADIAASAGVVNPEPTEAQKAAGNYRKQHVKWNGLDITVENPKDSTRSGKAPDGTEWSVEMPGHYGYLKRTRGADGDQVDVYIGDHLDPTAPVFVVDQKDPATGKFDEHKVVMGVPNEAAARALYERGFSDGKGAERLGTISEMTPDEFKAWLREGDTTKPVVKTKEVKAPAQPKSAEPMSLLQFIASMGGLKPDDIATRGDLKAMDLDGRHRVHVPGRRGFFGVVRPNGMSLDYMREAAQEAGYFAADDPNAPPTSSVRDFLNAIEDELRGKRLYPQGFEGHVPAREQALIDERIDAQNTDYEAQLEENRNEIRQMLADVGMPPVTSEEDLNLAAKIMYDEGLDPDDALERAFIRSVNAVEDDGAPVVTQNRISDTYDFGAIDAVQRQPTHEDVEVSSPEGDGNRRPGQEGRPAQSGDDSARAGQARGKPRESEALQEAERAQEASDGRSAPDQGVIAGEPAVEYDATPAGQQSVLPGAGRISDGELAQRKVDERLKPAVAQKAADEGLFGDESKQTDLLDRVAANAGKAPKERRTDIGTNADGQTIYEDARGVRSIVEDGVRLTETVSIKPDGTIAVARDDDRFRPVDTPPRPQNVETTEARESGPSDSEAKATSLADLFARKLLAGEKFANILAARRLAKENFGITDAKTVEEQIELGVVRAAREIVAQAGPRARSQVYRDLVELYGSQPKLGTRTSTSMRDQAFSTPVPLAYLASRLAGVEKADVVFEPAAGNGALLIEANTDQTVIANEINPTRAENLKTFGFNTTRTDASRPTQAAAIHQDMDGADVVIANPPFGALKEDGASQVFDLSDIQRGYKTTQIDHAIALRALSALRDDGRAVLLVGGLNKMKESREARSDGYNAKDKREFYKTLYDRYNVVDHFTVAGQLYERQGAGWPVDVIVIDGKGKSARALPAVDVPRTYTAWDQLGELINDNPVRANEGSPREENGRTARGDASRGAGLADGGVHPPARRGRISGQHAEPKDATGVRTGGVRTLHGDREADRDRGAEQLQPEARRDAGRSDPAHATERRAPRVEQETERQVAYKPNSTKTDSLGTLVPVNMQTSLQESLERVRDRVGDLDDFVASELGYRPDELAHYFGAEQVDALALAIDNLRRGKGFIIGDQTGIGKGRVNAAIIRWAIKNDRIPVFVTEKANLYGDMYRDLQDIGISDGFLDDPPRILVTNADANIPMTDDGKVVVRTPVAKLHNGELAALNLSNFNEKYDVVFTNYSQMQTVKGATTARRDFLSRIISNSVLIFDESHNAGGQAQSRAAVGEKADRAGYSRELVARANGVFYSSATYAKRPDVMDLYAATDMSMAVPNPSDLGEAIDKGGVPMQQVVATMLAQAGQYVRRERSFAGISYETPVISVNREAYDGISRALAQIQQFSEHVKTISETIDEDLKAAAAGVAHDNSVGDAGAKSVAFTSVMHNIISQLLLAMKAKGASILAIEAIRDGKKPVITLANTMESFFKNYADEIGATAGQPFDATFGDVLMRYLDRTRTLLIKKPYSTETERKYLTDGELGSIGTALYKETRDAIRDIDLADLPVSPIDAIKRDIQAAGYSVGEITGRGTVVDYSGPEPVLKARPGRETSIRGRRETIAAFNSGDLDAVILNQAGATGLSLHASEKFKDQRRRKMIIAQAEANIDTHMQMLGRVHRTGQVITPEYDQLVADIPAEKRPAAVLAKKMASLNASTTASRGGALTAKDVPDFINQYGDMVAASYIAENPEMNRRLGDPVKFKENGGLEIADVMRKMTGRIPLLPLHEQEELYELLEAEYDAFLKQMEAAGENALEAKTYDFKARTLESHEVVGPKADPRSPFGAPVVIEKVSVVRLGKPYPSHEVVERVFNTINDRDGFAPAEITKENAAERYTALLATAAFKNPSVALEPYKTALADFADYRRRVIDKLPDASRQEKEATKLDAIGDRWKEVIGMMPIGQRVTFKTATGNLTGIILKIEQKGQPKNPLALSSWKVTAAIADATRQITIPVSRLWPDGKADSEDQFAVEVAPFWIEPAQQTLDRFDHMQGQTREERYIATGNLLAAYDWLNNKGRIINYTDEDGAIRQGILTSPEFDLQSFADEKPTVLGTAPEVMNWLKVNRGKTIWSEDQVVRATLLQSGKLVIATEGAKKTGGKFYLDRALTDLTGDFIKSGGAMRADTWSHHEAAIDRLQKLGAVFAARKEPAGTRADVKYSIRPASSSLKGVGIHADGLTKALGIPNGIFWANYEHLAKKHPEYFKSPEDARDHVELVLSEPDVAIPQRNGFIDLVASGSVDRLVGFRAVLRGGRYNISTAYVLDPGQLERMKKGATQAGGTVLELNVPGVIDPAGRTDEYSRVDYPGQGNAEVAAAHRARIEDALSAVVSKIAGPDVAVRFVDTHPLEVAPRGWGAVGEEAITARGSYVPARDLITIAMADPRHPITGVLDTAFHEAFHAVENRLLTNQEMEILRRDEPRLRGLVREVFGFDAREIGTIADYEIRAMAFEHYASTRARGEHPVGMHVGIRRAFERLREIFARTANYLRGLGFRSANDVFAQVYEGGVADRPRTSGGAQMPRFNVRPEVRSPLTPKGDLNNFRSFDPLPENWREWWARPDLKWGDRVWGMIDAAFLPANRALGDRYVDMRRMQAAVEMTGKPITQNIDMALNATLFEGRVEKRLKDYWLKTWKPVLARAGAAGISREDLHTYLYARHAPERNAHIAEINPEMPDGGSGMTNDEAREVMERFADRRPALEAAAREIDQIVRTVRSMMVSDQLEHEGTIQGWENAYQFYVPLQGFEAGDETMAAVPGRSSGFDVRGAETRRALGRSSKADDILSNLFLMGERTIIRGEQNRVGRSAMRFMQSNPQPDLYTVHRSERVFTEGRREAITEQDLDLLLGERPVTVQRINKETGLVETVTKIASPFAKDSFAVKVGGHTYYIQIKHPGMLQALKNVGVQRLPGLVRAHAWLTRQFSAFRTARNPDWFVSNLFRDVQDAAYTLSAEQRQSLLKHFAANVGSLRTYIGAVQGEMMEGQGRIGAWARRSLSEKKGAKLYEDWKQAGGQIAFMGLHDLDAAKREIEAAFNATKESRAKTAAMAGPRAAQNILKSIEFFNGAIEAGTRLAVYDAALKAGMTRAKAAQLSKESTTNFNRKGIYSPFINSFYAFFNARVQGATKIIRLLRTSKMARRAAIGLALGGFAATMWNLAASPDDEEKKKKYAQRKYWERERYFIFYMPGREEPFRMPMGYGLQVFWMFGENLAMLSQGQITPAQAAANYLSTLVGAFSPIGAEGAPTDPGTWLRLIMPSIEMPLLELTTNENWRRKPIHPKHGGVGEPRSQQHFSTTSPTAIDIAQFLNSVTGGNAFTPGKIDVYPGDVQYLWEFAGGGLGQTADRTNTMLRNWVNGVPTPANQIPIVRHFIGQDVKQSSTESFYEDRTKVQEGMARVRRALNNDDPAKDADARRTIEDGYQRFDIRPGKRKGTIASDAEATFREATKELSDLRGQEAQVRADPKMSRKEKADLIEIIRDNMQQVQNEARKAYREMRPSP
ncbi:MAG TPA: LPD38 domain-containing protein [Xanthobacteraceae bacterium]|nr:LPD38 domain-containing protein [Xanthobacteraceae bacterium]